MTTSHIEIENEYVQEIRAPNQIQQTIDSVLSEYDQIIKSYSLFNLFFLTVGSVELVLFLAFFTFITQSAILSLSLALVFLTFFSYFILKLYFQAQKAEQLLELKEKYMRACKGVLNYKEGTPDHYIWLANSFSKLSDAFQGREALTIALPNKLQIIQPYLERFNRWCQWKDIYKMREVLLKAAIEENIALVKQQPTSLEAHAALANAYVMLSALYIEPARAEGKEHMPWILKDADAEELEKKFRQTSERAIEEFKIIKQFAPDNVWVHTQLAYSYHDLQMPLEEIVEYETLLKLTSNDNALTFKLGRLYFQQGMNAKGLILYGQLKEVDKRQAEELIKYYGSFCAN
jgi:tetratricopeptide (TPR) repeat protein